MSYDNAEWLLRKRYEETHLNFRTLWDLYLKFYTVFLTSNVAALAWVYSRGAGVVSRWPVSLAFFMQCVLVSVSSVLVAKWSKSSRAGIEGIVDAIGFLSSQKGEVSDKATLFAVDLPVGIACYGAYANSIGVLTLAVIWFYYGMGY
jgi:hypothetical protein